MLGDQSAERARFDVGGERQELVLPKQRSKGGVRCMHIMCTPTLLLRQVQADASLVSNNYDRRKYRKESTYDKCRRHAN